jgi:asparagine synthase (glutamine-hydrolysing)
MTLSAGEVWRFDFRAPDAPRSLDGMGELPTAVPDFRELSGDWSFAGWDPAGRVVILATDYAGVRPLCYSVDDRRVLWSASLGELVEATGAAGLDDEFVASFLSNRGLTGRTPYRQIRSVPPGHAVRIREGRVSVERYWDLPAHETRLSDGREYEERLRELFREAVATRVAGHERVCAELSGGLDSSSIVCMAAGLHPRTATVSYTHPGAADEPFIREVEARCGVSASRIDVREHPFATPAHTGGSAPGWWEARYQALARYLASTGATALLTGQLGDLVMGNLFDDSDRVAGLLRRLRFRDAGREAYLWSRALRMPIYPILWRAFRMAVSSWTPEPSDDLSPAAGQPRMTETSLTGRVAEAAAKEANPYEYAWRSAPPERRRRFRAAARMLSSQRLQVPEPLLHLSYTHPFVHRPLVEFMLTIPSEVVCGPGEPRRLQRRAFRDLLPERVLHRRSKASFGDAFGAALRPMAAEMARHPDRLRVVELGYVDRGSLLARLERYGQGLDCNALQLQTVILFEYWLRNRD